MWDSVSKPDPTVIERFKKYLEQKITDCEALKTRVNRKGAPACCGSASWDFSFTVNFNDLGVSATIQPTASEKTLSGSIYYSYDFRELVPKKNQKVTAKGTQLVKIFKDTDINIVQPAAKGKTGAPILMILTDTKVNDPSGTDASGYTLTTKGNNPATNLPTWGILLRTKASGRSFAHEVGHQVGYTPDAGNTDAKHPGHSNEKSSLMYYLNDIATNTKGEAVDCEYCSALSKYAK